MLIQYKDKETVLNNVKIAKKCMIIPEKYPDAQEIYVEIKFTSGAELNLGDVASITIGEKSND